MSAGRLADEPTGYCVVDKPAGMTSHDVVAVARRELGCRRVGHAGTLDPGATGVLVLGVGRATRLLRYVLDLEKSYVGEIVFGCTTTTLDDEGEPLERFDMSGLRPADVERGACALTGEIDQLPPMVSARKVAGRRLYELARQGLEVERERRKVHVSAFSCQPTSDPLVYTFSVRCSSGTYVRTLAADLGAALGGGAHLRGLRRTAIGSHTEASACGLRELGRHLCRPAAGLVSHLPAVTIDDQDLRAVRNGVPFGPGRLVGEGPWALFDRRDALVAVYERVADGRAKPAVVLNGSMPESETDERGATSSRLPGEEPTPFAR